MFTGLVEELGIIKAISKGQRSVRLTIGAKTVLEDAKIGDSIAVSGTCLTVIALQPDCFTADVMPETVSRTVLAGLKMGHHVNLERTLRLDSRLGGHIVSGHIDGVGRIVAKEMNDIAVVIRVHAAAEIMRYIIKKGSIAIDGISLTVVECGSDCFTVSLIPHTASMTTLGYKKINDQVNLEVDMIGKYVEKLLGLSGLSNDRNAIKPGLSIESLINNGF